VVSVSPILSQSHISMLEGSAYWPPCAGNLLERSDDMGLYATVWVQSPTHTKSMDKNRPKLNAVGLPFFAADSKKHLRFKSNSKAAAVGMP
jgi:hypothetical protein